MLSQVWKRTRREAQSWWRAFLQAIPGEIGCAVRRRLYGFAAASDSRVLSNVTIYWPEGFSIGRRSGVAAGCQIDAKGGVRLGDGVLVGPGSIIWSQNHRFRDRQTLIVDQGYDAAEVIIEDGVWIAAGCVILPGVRIGEGSVVAAGSVVTASTEPFSVVAGVPARAIGRRE